jgi:hypothetical protein
LLEAPPAFESTVRVNREANEAVHRSVFRAHYIGSVETDPLDDGMGSRAQARGEVNRATIDTIVQ